MRKLALFLLLISCIGCSSDHRDKSEQKTQQTKEENSPAVSLPLSASSYASLEPSLGARITKIPINDHFARQVYKDPKDPTIWQELIVGTGKNEDRIYAYFYFLPMSVIRAARDDSQMRLGLIMGKYVVLAAKPLEIIEKDHNLWEEADVAAVLFYPTPNEDPSRIEGIDIRGIHLIARPYKNSIAVITGLASDEWDKIRGSIIRGESNELYSLFPK